jgi:hypothetical protein
MEFLPYLIDEQRKREAVKRKSSLQSPAAESTLARNNVHAQSHSKISANSPAYAREFVGLRRQFFELLLDILRKNWEKLWIGAPDARVEDRWLITEGVVVIAIDNRTAKVPFQ